MTWTHCVDRYKTLSDTNNFKLNITSTKINKKSVNRNNENRL